MAFQTDFEFQLPKGYIDKDGNLHREGVMRLGTAADEILPLKDPRVQSNPSYLTIILLARVVTKLGTLAEVNTRVVEGLFVEDLAFLQQLYASINRVDESVAGEPNVGNGLGVAGGARTRLATQ